MLMNMQLIMRAYKGSIENQEVGTVLYTHLNIWSLYDGFQRHIGCGGIFSHTLSTFRATTVTYHTSSVTQTEVFCYKAPLDEKRPTYKQLFGLLQQEYWSFKHRVWMANAERMQTLRGW